MDMPLNFSVNIRMALDTRLYAISSIVTYLKTQFTTRTQLHQASLGLRYLHSRFIVHGDLKAVSCEDLTHQMYTEDFSGEYFD